MIIFYLFSFLDIFKVPIMRMYLFYEIKKNKTKLFHRDLSIGGTVDMTPSSPCRGPGLDPGRGTRSHMHATTKEPTCCN